jgi:hypothetical protein
MGTAAFPEKEQPHTHSTPREMPPELTIHTFSACVATSVFFMLFLDVMFRAAVKVVGPVPTARSVYHYGL